MPVDALINGDRVRRFVPAHFTLLRFLREIEGLTGTKCGCEIGECGSCTVILNGETVNSCLILAPEINGAKIWTVEGLAKEFELHAIQTAFLEHDAVHCGFCTPGLLMSATALLNEIKNPSEEEIKNYIAGNLCRCTGYIPVIRAIKNAAERLRNVTRPLFK